MRKATLLFFFLVLFSACALAEQHPRDKEIHDADTLAWWHTTEALSGGRDTGSAAYQRAAEYVAGRFRVAGLQPAGDRGTYYQSVAMNEVAVAGNGTSFTVVRTGGSKLPLEFLQQITITPAANMPVEYLVTSSFDSTARISRVLESAPEVVRLEHQGNLLTVALDAHGDHLATGNWDDTVIVWDTRSGSRLTEFKMEGAIYGLDFSHDSHYVAGTGDGVPGEIQVSELRGTKPTLSVPSRNGSRVVPFTPDNRYVAQESEENVIQLFALRDGKPAQRFEHQARPDTSDEIGAIAFSPDGKYLLTSRTDALVRTFDATSGKEQARFTLEHVPLGMIFSEDGHYEAARLSDNSGLVFQPAIGKIVTRLQPSGGVLAVALSPDARFVATGGNDHAAQVFDVLDGNPVARVECAGLVKAVAFSADGNYLISAVVENEGSEDVTVAVQRNFWRHQDLGMQACARLNRNFSLQEWQQYFPGQAPRKTCPNLP